MNAETFPVYNGNWADENALGEAFAARLVREMAEAGDPTTLAHVLARHLGRKLNGVEIGFFTTLAVMAFAVCAEDEAEAA